MAILLNCPLKHINGAVEFFLAHQSRMCEKPLENKNNNYTWYIYIYKTENQSSQNQWVASKTLISPFSLIKKKSIQLLFVSLLTPVLNHTENVHMYVYTCKCTCIPKQAQHTHRHTWTNRNYTHGHTQTHHHRHNALTPVQVKSSAEEWLHSAEQCYKPGLCSSAIAACGHLFLWSPFCFQTAGWMMLCSHSTGCWQEDKMHAIMFQVTWDRVGKTNVIILMM